MDVSGVKELKVDRGGRIFLPKGLFSGEGAPTSSRTRQEDPAQDEEPRAFPELYVTLSPDLCLLLVDQPEYRRLQKRMRVMDFGSRRVRRQQRLFFGLTSHVKPDKPGRIALTEKQRLFAGITNAVTMLCVGRRIELWSPERYAEQGLDDLSKLTEDSELIQDLDSLLSGEGFEQ